MFHAIGSDSWEKKKKTCSFGGEYGKLLRLLLKLIGQLSSKLYKRV